MGSVGPTSSVFSPIKAVPYDEAYRVVAALAADQTPAKVDLGAGVYKDDNGQSWTLPSVKQVSGSYICSFGLRPHVMLSQSQQY